MPLINKDKKADIHNAIQSGDTGIIKEIKKQPLAVEPPIKQPTKVAIPVKNPTEALFAEIMSGDLQQVKAAVAAGARVNAQHEKYGWTPLMEACQNEKWEIAKCLIDLGADVNRRDKYDYTMLMRAADDGDVNAIKLLTAAGADTEMKNNYRKTALMLAFKQHQKEAAEALLDAGANLWAKDKFGKTVIDHAVSDGWGDGVKLARERGAK